MERSCFLCFLLCLTVANAVDLKVRLAGEGSDDRQGRVEVLYKNRWGTICDDEFDLQDANVICKQLGYAEGASAYKTEAFFGRGVGQIWISYMECDGSEFSIDGCEKALGPNQPCSHSEDAGVICQGEKDKREDNWEMEVKDEKQALKKKAVLLALAELLAELENK